VDESGDVRTGNISVGMAVGSAAGRRKTENGGFIAGDIAGIASERRNINIAAAYVCC